MIKKHDIRINKNKLHPYLRYKLDNLLKKCAKKGIYLIITEGYRSKEYQDKLYAKGRTAPGRIVTNAKGSSYASQHMWGIAFDIAINDKKHLYDRKILLKVGKIARKMPGLSWGGDWKSFKDMPHFYLNKWGSTTSKLRRQYSYPSKFKKTWTADVKRGKGLILWKNMTKTKAVTRIPNGGEVDVMYKKFWYAKVYYKGHIGYVIRKYIR